MSVRISEWHSVQCVVSLQGVVPEPLQWSCLPACRSQLVTGRWLLDSSPVSTFRAVTLVRTVSHLPARALRVRWGHTSGGFAGPSSARSAELGSSGSAAATQADCCVGFYGEKTRGICGAREEAEAPGSKTDRAAWAGRGGRGRRGSPLPGREGGEVSGYGAPVRPAPDLQREWDLSGGFGGAGIRALAGGLLLGALPEGASGSHTGTLVPLVRRAAVVTTASASRLTPAPPPQRPPSAWGPCFPSVCRGTGNARAEDRSLLASGSMAGHRLLRASPGDPGPDTAPPWPGA